MSLPSSILPAPSILAAIAVASLLAGLSQSARDTLGADSQRSGRIANPDTGTNDSKPSFAVLADGSTWMAWHAYSPGRDRICARRLGPDGLGPIVEVGAEVASAWFNDRFNAGLLHRVLNAGHRMGFAGNSDSHRRHPGLAGALTAVYAEALTGDAILEALHNRRFYATNGSWIVLDSRANGSLIGQQIEAPDGVAEITLTAIGTRPIVSATLVGDGRELKTFSGTGQREFHARYRTQSLGQGTHWFYWRIVQEGSSPQFPGNVCAARGHLAWCSPHWVTVP